ncbi:septum formation protein Maf [Ancylomarina euxinus]|uniref:dTTP/UTP pyrophosphatase n=1 Tax=Ancylomarina euxinus TaxID=2283627 RepID=A0A425Y0E2_9BACT|nr:Maf-like protein [Ancylomarina euxinus]MCZ4695300.1 Maf-like protein [Ancylomarina euxinus]MUP15495.1 septum formation protein Maf [Ancylomarina euxinus]RRG21202.1 septum formation protein Maf [Ancylomarina euxinus]
MLNNLKNYHIILASQSPRRHQMLKELGLDFKIQTKDVEEVYPDHLKGEEIPVYLAKLKAEAFVLDLNEKELVITADTIVCVDDMVLGKPKDRADAVEMLKTLSGRSHQVISGVCLKSKHKEASFSTTTHVHFKELSLDEIDYYIDNYKPFDKAGAYGIQEWIGFVGIDGIEGSYFNVVGLPIQRLYQELSTF